MLRSGVDVERRDDSRRRHLDDEALHVDDDLGVGIGFDRRPDLLDDRLREHDRDEPVLRAVVEEDVAEARRDDGVEAVLLDRPDRVFT